MKKLETKNIKITLLTIAGLLSLASSLFLVYSIDRQYADSAASAVAHGFGGIALWVSLLFWLILIVITLPPFLKNIKLK